MNERVNPLPLSIQKESKEIKDIQKTKEKDASVACYSKKTKISFFFPSHLSVSCISDFISILMSFQLPRRLLASSFSAFVVVF